MIQKLKRSIRTTLEISSYNIEYLATIYVQKFLIFKLAEFLFCFVERNCK